MQSQNVARDERVLSRPRLQGKAGIGFWGWSYLVYMLVFALLPSSLNPRVRLAPFYASVLSFCFVLIGFAAFMRNFVSSIRFYRQWNLLAAAILILGIAGVINNQHLDHGFEFLVAIWPMMIFLSAPSLIHRLANGLRGRIVRLRLALAILVTVIAVVYALATVIAPRLGFRGGKAVAFGEARLEGPLANAATIYIILLPTLGFWAMQIRKGRMISWIGIVCCLLALFLTFSRAAILSLCLWFVWMFLRSRALSFSRKVVILFVVLLVGFGLFSIASSELMERIQSLESSPRSQTYITAWRAFRASPVLGHGFSHLWPWWGRQGALASGLLGGLREGRFVETAYGRSVWNPHSLLALFGAETGVVGLALAGLFLGLSLFQGGSKRNNRELFIALLIVVIMDSLLTGSLYAFPELSSIWWLYLVSISFDGANPTE